MSQKPFSKNFSAPFKMRTKPVQADASTVKPASTQNTSANGVKSSGKRSQTRIEYGSPSSFKSVTSQNGGASVISISDKAKAVLAFSEELKDLEKLQLEVGEQMAKLVFDQMRLAEKCRIINCSMEALLK